MKDYLLDVTFFAGSDDLEDMDRGLYLLSVDKEYSEEEMTKVFNKVNGLLDTFNEEEEAQEFLLSYDVGLNIDTLMEGVEMYTEGKVIKVQGDSGSVEKIDNCFIIEQWQ